MEIGLITALLGGTLALLSPCGALLLPTFFASTVGAGPRLLLHAGVFYVGMVLVLVPLGVGFGALGALLSTQRQSLVLVASVLLVALGVAQLLGLGFDASRLVPGASGLQSQAATATGLGKTFLLGATGGVAGVCAGPILGAVLTVATARGDSLSAAFLLAVYGLGMVIPLTLIAAAWTKLGERGRSALRGRAITVLGRELHTTSIFTGVLIIAVGVMFWMTNGLVDAPELVPLEMQDQLQAGVASLANPTVDVIALLVLAALALLWWVSGGGRSPESRPQSTPKISSAV